MLSDKQIRTHLDRHIRNRIPSGSILKHEQSLHNGNVVADLLAISKSLHVYEIKGDLDKISRLEVQALYYNRVSPKITLVTTAGNVDKALKMLPNYWGIMIAKKTETKIGFNYIRAATNNVDFSKYYSLLVLWKDELVHIATQKVGLTVKSRQTREELAHLISINSTKKDIIDNIAFALADRYKNLKSPENTSFLTNSK